MVFRRRMRRRFKRYSKIRRFFKKYSRGAYRSVKSVYPHATGRRPIARPEKKYVDSNTTTNPTNATLFSSALNISSLVAQGSTDLQRIGDKINLKGLYVSFEAESNTDAIAPTVLRCMVVQWHELNTAFTSNTQVLQAQGGTVYLPHQAYTHDEAKTFTVIYDKLYSLPGPFATGDATTPTSASGFNNKFLINLGKAKWVKKVSKYVAGTVNGYDHIFIIFITDVAVALAPTVYMTARLTFTDY